MKIFLSNDDGINSNGLISLAKKLSIENELLIIAPNGNRSASAHSMTVGKPIKINKVNILDGVNSYEISGTPVDCVKMSKLLFPNFKADLVVAGINKGHNLGSDILYSGTLSIACESAFFDNISFAFSSFNLGESDFDLFSNYAEKIIKKLYPISRPGDIWNVNFPDTTKIKGIKFTKLGKQIYSDRYELVSNNTYKLIGELLSHDQNCDDCDVEWIKKGYITITPILYNKTNFSRLDSIDVNFFDE